MLFKKSELKSLVKKEGYRLSPEALDGIDRSMKSIVKKMLTKVAEDGMKTLMAQHTAVGSTPKTNKSNCQRCCNIEEPFIRHAKSTQAFCAEEAVIMHNRYRKGGK